MDDAFSVSSPRRVFSVSRSRKESPSYSEIINKGPGFGSSSEHGPKTSEVYGFVGAITTIVATVIFLVWAYVPDSWLQSVGITYFPSRYWALAVPSYLMVATSLGIVFYIGLNFMVTPPPSSFNTILDGHSGEPFTVDHLVEGDEPPIEPISDIGLDPLMISCLLDVISAFDIVTPVAYSRSGDEIMLVQDSRTRFWYNLEDGSVRMIEDSGFPHFYEYPICVESLVPLSGKAEEYANKRHRKNIRAWQEVAGSWRKDIAGHVIQSDSREIYEYFLSSNSI